MEIARARFMEAHLPAARRIRQLAIDMGRPDLDMRARLVIADVEARSGAPLDAVGDLERVSRRATAAGNRYVLARSHFLLCTVRFAIGDLPSARIHGVHGVEMLPDDAPIPIRIDHLVMLAVAYGSGAEADECYRHALDLTAVIGDVDKTIGIHNNLAYFAWESGDIATATGHVERMLKLSTLRGIPLKASALDTVARVHIRNGRFADAIAVLGPAVDDDSGVLALRNVGVLHTEPYALPECLRTLAEAHRMLGDYDSAQHAIDRAMEIAETRGLDRTRANVLLEQADLFAARGDFRHAYEAHTAFHAAATRLHSDEQEARARIVQVSYDAGERRRDTARFRELAMRDALTGLYNRRFIDEQLATLTAQAAANRTPLSAAIADADFFKRINDEHSHDVGDRVLRTMASIIAAAVVAPETAGRLGGEEFVILMPNVAADEAYRRCEQIRSAISDHDWAPLVDTVPVTVSIGVSTAGSGQTSPAALLSDADRNLYAAKRSGRNRVMADTR